MIPLRLEMEAFLPFKDKTVIDFTTLGEEKLFLITGKTGSGKTSVFDAMIFALYGQLSGSQRDVSQLKSQFAAEEQVCRVTFSFLSKGELFEICRTPIQYTRKRNGNLTQSPATAVLTLQNGEVLQKITEINQKIEESIGLTLDQFKKIVMLPQGEFRRFLHDSSSEKQKILRKIFGTEPLERFTEKLKEQDNALKRLLLTAKTQKQSCMETIRVDPNTPLYECLQQEYPNEEELFAGLALYNEALAQQVEQERKAVERYTKQRYQIDLQKAEEQNNQLDRLAQVQKEQEKLQTEKPGMEQLRQKITHLQNCKELLLMLRHTQAQKQKILLIQQEVQTQKDRIKQLAPACQNIEEEWNRVQKENEATAELVSRLSRINEGLAQFARWEQYQKELGDLQKSYALSEKILCYLSCKEQQAQVKQTLELIRQVKKHHDAWVVQQEEYTRHTQTYQAAFSSFLQHQAGVLSLSLQEGMPCPVCGSIEHPAPACQQEETVTSEELHALQQKQEEVFQKANDLYTRLQQLISRLIPLLEQPWEWSDDQQENQARILQRGRQYRRIYDSLQEKIDQIGLGESQKQSLPTQAEAEKEAARLQASITLLQQKAEELLDKLQADGLHKQQLIEEKNQIEARMQKLTRRIQEVDAKRKEIRSSYDAAKATLEQLQKQGEEEDHLHRRSKGNLEEKLLQHGLTLTDLKEQQKELPRLLEYQETLEQYEKRVASTQALLQSLQEQLQGVERQDLDALRAKLAAIKEALISHQQQYEALSNRLHVNLTQTEKLRGICDAIRQQEQEYQQLHQLFATSSGDNKDKLSFERYVLGVYFDQVIDYANLRLEQMTAARYRLKRRRDREKGNSASGLDLDVFDAHTGKYRHVNTLSGGESFKTALSLALGLSDVIAQNNGGIEIDAIFIDEGFGSLDGEALEQAIACLHQIKNHGRYIGIISHVQELKERIPMKLHIIATPQGSHAAFSDR